MSMSSQQLEGLIDSIARRVTLRASTPVYLTLERELRVLGAFNSFEPEVRQDWVERAFKARMNTKTIFATSILPRIHRSMRLMKDAVKKGNFREAKNIARNLVEHGVAYNNTKALHDVANSVFDANYDQYQTIPISDFKMPSSKDSEDEDISEAEMLPIFTDDLEKQERAAHATIERIDQMRPNKPKGVGDVPFIEVLKYSEEEWAEILDMAHGVERDD